jgi:glycosyltransferase involved in cell wall biosynthesis
MSKKIGILTYYWPPAGGSGVQRWLRFSNELAKLGHNIHVFTFKNPKYPIVDKELLNKVDSKVKVNFISGFELPNFLTNKNSNSAESFKSGSVKSFVRELFFFPDSRKYLISSSVKYIKKYIKKTPLNCLITSGPPHSMHLVGLKLRKTTNLKWIADFRDPWSNFIQNKFLNKLESTKIKHEKKENLVLKFSDAVLTTSKSLNNKFKKKNHNTFYTPSGFENFIKPKAYNKFRILYAGSMKEFQNPINLWIVLRELIESDNSFKNLVEIILIGNIDKSIIENKEFRLLQNTKIVSYLSKNNLDEEISISELLMVCSVNIEGSNDIIPGKFFHYLSSGKRILGISNKGADLENIIKETKSGMSFSYDNHTDLKNYIYKCFSDYKDGKESSQKTDNKFLSSNIAIKIDKIISKL